MFRTVPGTEVVLSDALTVVNVQLDNYVKAGYEVVDRPIFMAPGYGNVWVAKRDPRDWNGRPRYSGAVCLESTFGDIFTDATAAAAGKKFVIGTMDFNRIAMKVQYVVFFL